MADQFEMDALKDAVIEAVGSDVESLEAVYNHGVADTTNFCYTHRCYTFYNQHASALWEVATDAADDMGVSIWDFIKGLNTCDAEGQDHLVTGLVWFAMESICREAYESLEECTYCSKKYIGSEFESYCSEKCYNEDNEIEQEIKCTWCDAAYISSDHSGYCSKGCYIEDNEYSLNVITTKDLYDSGILFSE